VEWYLYHHHVVPVSAWDMCQRKSTERKGNIKRVMEEGEREEKQEPM
jgi:hypothetical protein